MLKDKAIDHERGFAGCWKRIPNQISGIDLKLVQPYEVDLYIEELLKEWEHSTKDIDAVMRFHAQFENIHPFQDGNGRVGRFIMLKQCFENEIDLIMIDDMYSKEYKQALYQAQKHQDFNELKNIFTICQQRLEEKLEFLKETLAYMQKHPLDMD